MASGALAGTGAGLPELVLGNAALSGMNYAATQKITSQSITADGLFKSQVLGALSGFLGGNGALAGKAGKQIFTTKNAMLLAKALD